MEVSPPNKNKHNIVHKKDNKGGLSKLKKNVILKGPFTSLLTKSNHDLSEREVIKFPKWINTC